MSLLLWGVDLICLTVKLYNLKTTKSIIILKSMFTKSNLLRIAFM